MATTHGIKLDANIFASGASVMHSRLENQGETIVIPRVWHSREQRH